jgi:acetone carboxylase gamma subunit
LNGSHTVLFEVGIGLRVLRNASGKVFWACSDCPQIYCPVEENPKVHAKILVGQLREIGHPTAQMTRLEQPRFFLRQFFCPQCGILWAGEVARPEDPILFSIEYDRGWLESLQPPRSV